MGWLKCPTLSKENFAVVHVWCLLSGRDGLLLGTSVVAQQSHRIKCILANAKSAPSWCIYLYTRIYVYKYVFILQIYVHTYYKSMYICIHINTTSQCIYEYINMCTYYESMCIHTTNQCIYVYICIHRNSKKCRLTSERTSTVDDYAYVGVYTYICKYLHIYKL